MSPRRRSDSPSEPRDDQGRPIHERIRQLRTEKGLAAAELARRADISPAYVTRIEKGEKVPSEAVAVRIAKILGDDTELYLWWVHGQFISDPRSTLEGFRKSAMTESPPASTPQNVDLLRSRQLAEEVDGEYVERARARAEQNREHMERVIRKQEELLANLGRQGERLEHEVERQQETLERLTPETEVPRKLSRAFMMQPSRRFAWRKKKKEARSSESIELEDAAAIVPQEAMFVADFAADPGYPSAGVSRPIKVRLYDNAEPAPSAPEWIWLDTKLLPDGVEASKLVAHRLSEEEAGHLGDLGAGDVAVVARGFDDPPAPERIYLVAATHDTAAAGRSTAPRLTRVRLKDDKLLLISEGERSDVEIIDLTQERPLKHWLLGRVVLVIRSAPGE